MEVSMSFREFVTGQVKPTKRTNLLKYWQSLRPDMPMTIKPIAVDHSGSTRLEDGIRITGSPIFIAACLARLKEVLMYETEKSKIEIVYNQAANTMDDGKMSYVVYVQVHERGSHKNPADKLFKPKKPSVSAKIKPPKPI
jgi:ribosomal protein L16/L10AE